MTNDLTARALSCFGFCFLSICASAGNAVQPALEWHVPTAQWRIAVAPPPELRATVLHVDLPLELAQQYWTCEARTFDTGRPIPSRALHSPKGVTGVLLLFSRAQISTAVRTAKKTGRATPVAVIYLTPASTSAKTPKRTGAFPAATLSRTLVRLRTRPFFGKELLRYLGRSRRLRYTIDVPQFTGTVPYEKWASPPAKYTAVMHWSSELDLDQSQVRRFGADHDQTAWFFFVDRRFVAGWKEGDRLENGARLGGPLTLEPGPHRLDFFILLQHEEKLPTALWASRDGAPEKLPDSRLSVCRRPSALCVQRKNDGAAVGFEYGFVTRYTHPETNADFLLLDILPFAARGFTVPKNQSVVLPGRTTPQPLPIQHVVIPDADRSTIACVGNNASGLRITVPAPRVWGPLLLNEARLHVTSIPSVTTPAAFSIGARILDCPSALWKGVRPFVRLTPTRGEFADGATGLKVLSDGLLRIRFFPPPTSTLKEFSVGVFGGAPLTVPTAVRIVRPNRLPAAVSVRGDRCFDETGTPVVFVPYTEPSKVGVKPPVTMNSTSPLILVDEILAVARGPGAGLDPAEFLRNRMHREVRCIELPTFRDGDAASALFKFTAAPDALRDAGAVVVWAVGALDVLENHPPQDTAVALLFLVQATRAAGCTPVLAAWPPLPGSDVETARRTALLTKEIGIRTGAVVVDAWSAAMSETPDGTGFAATFRDPESGVGLPTPNDEGRRWLLALIADAVGASAAAADSQ